MLNEQSKESEVIVDKVSFVVFIAEVVNCSAQTESRTERIKIIIRVAEKYLELEDVMQEVELLMDKNSKNLQQIKEIVRTLYVFKKRGLNLN